MPPFNELSYLPTGIYEISWSELMARFAANLQRQRIATGLATALRKLVPLRGSQKSKVKNLMPSAFERLGTVA
ncbi:MAG: hypothetical protein KME17_30800 [Cyanosarcina radialis HA8281-LM2]|nr:hypothetical protein [Cyanosarcina radialis HA8281-LM2]